MSLQSLLPNNLKNNNNKKSLPLIMGEIQLRHCGKSSFLEGSVHENTEPGSVFLFHYFMPNTVCIACLSNHSVKCPLRRSRVQEKKSKGRPQGTEENLSIGGSENHPFGLIEGKENVPYLMSPDLP